ncbi:MAG: hypothetical protein SVY53_04335 [Chloroflexota bacterium]|nr:hypothetical protein [Chloroflexota bacterium]
MTVIPKDASSVLLVRDSPSGKTGLEVLMVRRNVKSDFAADAYVFPGGAVEGEDYLLGDDCSCSAMTLLEAQRVVKNIPYPEKALGFLVAGIRETFEEVGILIAYVEGGAGLQKFEPELAQRLSNYRQEMQQGRLSFMQILLREGMVLATDQLIHFAHWITPEFSPVRYDTHFFISPMPPGQRSLHDDTETTASQWLSPQEAIEKAERQEFSMLAPTISNLRILAGYSSIQQAMAATKEKDIITILPKVKVDDGEMRLLMPGDPEYS